jgi:hypothetical protein
MLRCLFDKSFYIAAGHEGLHDIRLSLMVAEIVDGDDIRVVAELSHRLSFPLDAGAGNLVQLFGLYEGECDVSVQRGVMGEVYLLLAAFSKELLDLVATPGE